MQLPKHSFIWYTVLYDWWEHNIWKTGVRIVFLWPQERALVGFVFFFVFLLICVVVFSLDKHTQKRNYFCFLHWEYWKSWWLYFMCGKTGRVLISTIWEETGWRKLGWFATNHYTHIKLHSNREGMLLCKAGGEKWKSNCVASVKETSKKGSFQRDAFFVVRVHFLCSNKWYATDMGEEWSRGFYWLNTGFFFLLKVCAATKSFYDDSGHVVLIHLNNDFAYCCHSYCLLPR